MAKRIMEYNKLNTCDTSACVDMYSNNYCVNIALVASLHHYASFNHIVIHFRIADLALQCFLHNFNLILKRWINRLITLCIYLWVFYAILCAILYAMRYALCLGGETVDLNQKMNILFILLWTFELYEILYCDYVFFEHVSFILRGVKNNKIYIYIYMYIICYSCVNLQFFLPFFIIINQVSYVGQAAASILLYSSRSINHFSHTVAGWYDKH